MYFFIVILFLTEMPFYQLVDMHSVAFDLDLILGLHCLPTPMSQE